MNSNVAKLSPLGKGRKKINLTPPNDMDPFQQLLSRQFQKMCQRENLEIYTHPTEISNISISTPPNITATNLSDEGNSINVNKFDTADDNNITAELSPPRNEHNNMTPELLDPS